MPTDPIPASRLPVTSSINAWYRGLAVLLGLAGLGSGGVAVFITHLEAGPAALLIVGLILLLVGIGGRMPSRIKIGDNEASWEAVEQFVENVTTRTPADQQDELLADLNTLAKEAPQAASAGLSALAYENLVVRMIHDTFIGLPEKTPGTVSALGRNSDMVLDTPDRIVAFEVKYSAHPVEARAVAQAVSTRASLAEQSEKPVTLILVSSSPLTASALQLLNGLPEVFAAVVKGPQDRNLLMAAVRGALRLEDGSHYFES